jgi:predicted dinucleotide-binding enzyme
MRIGIVGADDRAVAIARLLLKAGHRVTLSDPTGHNAAHNAEIALDYWATQATPGEQAMESDALVLAVHWQDLENAIEQVGAFQDGILIDATRPPAPLLENGTSGAEQIAKRMHSAHVVKGFVDVSDPKAAIEIASDDSRARNRVAEVIAQCGATARDLGALANASRIERGYIDRHTYP